MRIALVNPRPQRRGGEISSRSLAEGLRRRGHELLEVYLYPRTGADPLPPAAAEILLGGREGHWAERCLGWQPALLRDLRAALRSFGPDVVQVSGGRTVKYGALVLATLEPQPLLVYRSIGEPDAWVRGWRRRLLYRRRVFPRVGAVATIARQFIPRLTRLCRNAREVRCIPTELEPREPIEAAIGERLRAGLATGSESPVVLFAGKLSREKRIDRLLRAFRATLEKLPTATLWIAGDGPLESQLKELASRLDLSDRTRFLGVRSDVGELMTAADVIALTSDTEGVPLVLREAAARGRPAVATRVGATAEIVVDGETGLLVESEDEEGFAGALVRLLADPASRQKMGQAARLRQETEGLSSAAIAREFESLYRDALAKPATEARA